MNTLNAHIARAKGYEVRYAADAMTLEYRIDSTPPGVVAWVSVPDWEHDLNAAIRLVDAWFTLECTGPEGWRAMFVYPQTVAYAATPAAAICEAWLVWHETQTVNEP